MLLHSWGLQHLARQDLQQVFSSLTGEVGGVPSAGFFSCCWLILLPASVSTWSCCGLISRSSFCRCFSILGGCSIWHGRTCSRCFFTCRRGWWRALCWLFSCCWLILLPASVSTWSCCGRISRSSFCRCFSILGGCSIWHGRTCSRCFFTCRWGWWRALCWLFSCCWLILLPASVSTWSCCGRISRSSFCRCFFILGCRIWHGRTCSRCFVTCSWGWWRAPLLAFQLLLADSASGFCKHLVLLWSYQPEFLLPMLLHSWGLQHLARQDLQQVFLHLQARLVACPLLAFSAAAG